MTTLLELAEATRGELLPADDVPLAAAVRFAAVCTDSRAVEPGNLFWALRGQNHNGSDFAADALERGAVAAVVERAAECPPRHWLLRVDDTVEALRALAAWKRARFGGAVIAVTGSMGKTTTRQMIHTLLGAQLRGSASPKNYNNHLGVPLSMTEIEPHHDYAVLELGASRAGEIGELAGLCSPTIGVITGIGDAHLGGFGSRETIAGTKTELLEHLPADGHAVLADDPWLRLLAGRCRAPITWVGITPQCDLVAEDVYSGGGRLSFRVEQQRFYLPVWGRHHLTAALAAVAVGRLLGLHPNEMADVLEDYVPVPMRCEVAEIRGAKIINDAYNANPTAMRAALELLRDLDAEGKRIVVCGDMLELGGESIRLHRDLGRQAVEIGRAELLIACGRYSREVVAGAREAGLVDHRAIPCLRADDALPHLSEAIGPGDAVLVKGSRLMAMERVIAGLNRAARRRSA